MRILITIGLIFCFNGFVEAQETIGNENEQDLEAITAAEEATTEDDSYLQQMEYYKRHRMNLNTASASDLTELHILTAVQIENLIMYRNLLGNILETYELQAIPSWNLEMIHQLLPYIYIGNNPLEMDLLKQRWQKGNQSLLIRTGKDFPNKNPNQPAGALNPGKWQGSDYRLFIRYKYNYKNLLQWGLLGEKDAGESFLSGAQKKGFDFYSFHVFAKELGLVKTLALGDFTVNFGQGLIQWQSLAFRKSPSVLSVKRQANSLRPYNSAGEFNFHRGLGITLQVKNWEASCFASFRKLSSNFIYDTITGSTFATSFQTSGYHRTAAEIADKNTLGQQAFGGNLKFKKNRFQLGINSVVYQFSVPVKSDSTVYNQFAFRGKSLMNFSVDYGITLSNVHFFGEAAMDHHLNKAILSGALISLDTKLDASIVYRNISRAYQSISSNAFTENAKPVNEQGLFAGIEFRSTPVVKIAAYSDVYKFPWLKYRVDAPSYGSASLLQLSYTPNKKAALYLRYKFQTSQINSKELNASMAVLDPVMQQGFRIQANLAVSRELQLRNRLEWIRVEQANRQREEGLLLYAEGFYHASGKRWAANLRLQYFETNGFDSRIYAFENDLPFSYSIPFYYGKGLHYYFNYSCRSLSWKTNKKNRRDGIQISFNFKWSQTIAIKQYNIFSDLNATDGNLKSQFKFQLIFSNS